MLMPSQTLFYVNQYYLIFHAIFFKILCNRSGNTIATSILESYRTISLPIELCIQKMSDYYFNNICLTYKFQCDFITQKTKSAFSQKFQKILTTMHHLTSYARKNHIKVIFQSKYIAYIFLHDRMQQNLEENNYKNFRKCGIAGNSFERHVLKLQNCYFK